MRRATQGESMIFDNTFFDITDGKIENPLETEEFSVIQAVDSRYFYRLTIPEHMQYPDIELTAVVDGALVNFADGVSLPLQKGECALSFRGEKHALSAHNTCRFLTIAFNLKNPSDPSVLSRLKEKYCKQKFSKSRVFSETLQIAIHEFYAIDEYTARNLNALITELLVELLREKERKTEPSTEGESDLLAVAVGYMDTHAADMVTVREAADHIHLSYSAFFRLFKSCLGLSPVAYLAEKKMQCAKELLAATDLSLSEIADRLGYSNPYNFSRAFRQKVGCSPSDWKRTESAGRRGAHDVAK